MIVPDERPFVEVGSYQSVKNSGAVCGDTFATRPVREERRMVCALSDGLGSGIKARVLSSLTATMAVRYAVEHIDLRKAADIIMRTLPVCAERRISYSTFTLVDVKEEGAVSIVEYDNPPFIWLRKTEPMTPPVSTFTLPGVQNRTVTLRFSVLTPRLGDRIVFFTDGVTQAGMGRHATPFGWGRDAAVDFVRQAIGAAPDIAADDLARKIVQQAGRYDGLKPGDDTSCGVIGFRNPRRLLIVTGPPFDPEKDAVLALRVRDHAGSVILSGGTTSQIVARQLDREITVDLAARRTDLPPPARMDGVALITEGTITVSRVVRLLEEGGTDDGTPAGTIVKQMLASDIIEFLVGTRINQAHQNPALPVELDIRRNIIRRIRDLLESRFCKETVVEYL